MHAKMFNKYGNQTFNNVLLGNLHNLAQNTSYLFNSLSERERSNLQGVGTGNFIDLLPQCVRVDGCCAGRTRANFKKGNDFFKFRFITLFFLYDKISDNEKC